MLKIYHNPNCSKSKCAIDFLNEHHRSYVIVDYMHEGIDEEGLIELLKMLQVNAEYLVRKIDLDNLEIDLPKHPTDDYWIKLMLENPKLIQRPIVVYKNRAVIARPLELIETLFEEA